ncbi:ATP-binding protein [Salipaludibacillus sp. HK11]|uniref:ATP-binding protein n=1 Tax=Salipaludibacillus sp. HK11 TaxID=3394320 RepID=UPI0039FC9696
MKYTDIADYKLIYLVAILVIILSACFVDENAQTPLANDGLISLNDPIEGGIALDGEWHFYWNKLYTPEDLQTNHLYDNHAVPVPNDWNTYNINEDTHSRSGYATYHLQVDITKKDIGKIHSLYMPSTASAYQLWVNGEQLANNGVVGTSREEMKPNSTPKIINFYANSETIDIVIQISNFHQRKSGLFDSVVLGDYHTLFTNYETTIIYRSIIIASLFSLGLYYLSHFFVRRKNRSSLYFALACIAIASRAITIEEGLAQYLFGFLSWEMMVKIEYLGASLAAIFFTLFAFTQLNNVMNRHIRNGIIGMMGMYSLFVIITPTYVFTLTMTPFQFGILACFFYLIYVYIVAYTLKHHGTKLSLITMLLFALTIFNDILYFNGVIQTAELTSVGMFIFLISQAYNLSRSHARSVQQTEELSERLSRLNASLENKIENRTSQLKLSNQQLSLSNKELVDAQQAQNRLLSNVSHELGTPLTTMKGYIQGMAEGILPFNKKYMNIINQKVNYLTQIFYDLESLSRINLEEVSFDFKQVDALEFWHSLYETYRIDLQNSMLTFSFENLLPEEERFVICIDKYRMEQVFVNFISNARKAIQGSGSITIRLSLTEQNELLVECIDTGIGINEQETKLLFERFFRSHQRESNLPGSGSGSGLGLSISKEIVERHNGRIGAYSNAGDGATFFISLPIA